MLRVTRASLRRINTSEPKTPNDEVNERLVEPLWSTRRQALSDEGGLKSAEAPQTRRQSYFDGLSLVRKVVGDYVTSVTALRYRSCSRPPDDDKAMPTPNAVLEATRRRQRCYRNGYCGLVLAIRRTSARTRLSLMLKANGFKVLTLALTSSRGLHRRGEKNMRRPSSMT